MTIDQALVLGQYIAGYGTLVLLTCAFLKGAFK